MKAIVLTGKEDKKVDIVTKKLRPLQHGEALLKMQCCGVCHSDLHLINFPGVAEKAGTTLGHEGVGVVTAVGPGVTSLKVGDRATVAWFFEGCGACEYCIIGDEAYCPNQKNGGWTADGGMAEECIVTADYSVKVPDGLDSAAASSMPCAGVTVYKALKEAKVKPGQWVAIYGVGGLGNLAVQFAKNVFGAKVVALDTKQEQLDFAKESGADLVINNGTEKEHVKLLKEKVGGGGVHACIVTAPSTSAFKSGIDSVRPRGHFIGLGFPPEGPPLGMQQLGTGIHIMGSIVGTRQDLKEALDFAAEGKVKPKVTLRKMGEINDVFEEMAQVKFRGRMVLKIE